MRFSMNQSRQIILPTHLTRYKRETDKAGGEARIRHQTRVYVHILSMTA